MIYSLENHDRTALARSAPQQKLERVGCTEQLIYHLLCYSILSRIIFRHHVLLLLPCSTAHSLQSISECRKMQDSGCHVQESTQVRYSTVYSIHILYTRIYIHTYIHIYILYTMHVHAQRSNVVQLHGTHAPAWRLRLAQFSSLCFLLGEQPVTEIESLWRTNSAEQIHLRSSHPVAACSNLSRIWLLWEMQNSAKPAQHGARSSRQDYKTLKCQGKYKSMQIKGTFVCTSRSSARTPGCDLSLWALVNA